MQGTSGISAYLIPYSAESSKNTLFSVLKPSHENQDLNIFSQAEKEILNKLKPLLDELDKALKSSNTLKDIKYKDIENFLKSISISESKLVILYRENLEIIDSLLKLSNELHSKNSEKLQKQSNLENITYQRKLLNSLNEAFRKWNDSLEEVVQEIKKDPTKSSPEGGGGVSKAQKAKHPGRQDKH